MPAADSNKISVDYNWN